MSRSKRKVDRLSPRAEALQACGSEDLVLVWGTGRYEDPQTGFRAGGWVRGTRPPLGALFCSPEASNPDGGTEGRIWRRPALQPQS